MRERAWRWRMASRFVGGLELWGRRVLLREACVAKTDGVIDAVLVVDGDVDESVDSSVGPDVFFLYIFSGRARFLCVNRGRLGRGSVSSPPSRIPPVLAIPSSSPVSVTGE